MYLLWVAAKRARRGVKFYATRFNGTRHGFVRISGSEIISETSPRGRDGEISERMPGSGASMFEEEAEFTH